MHHHHTRLTLSLHAREALSIPKLCGSVGCFCEDRVLELGCGHICTHVVRFKIEILWRVLFSFASCRRSRHCVCTLAWSFLAFRLTVVSGWWVSGWWVEIRVMGTYGDQWIEILESGQYVWWPCLNLLFLLQSWCHCNTSHVVFISCECFQSPIHLTLFVLP